MAQHVSAKRSRKCAFEIRALSGISSDFSTPLGKLCHFYLTYSDDDANIPAKKQSKPFFTAFFHRSNKRPVKKTGLDPAHKRA